MKIFLIISIVFITLLLMEAVVSLHDIEKAINNANKTLKKKWKGIKYRDEKV